MTISDLEVGERGIVEGVEHPAVPLKLLEMGCLPGSEVELMQLAPLKDPICIRVNGSYIAIRQDTARLISIHKVN